TAALLGAALLVPAEAVAQDKTGATWPSPVATRGPVAEKEKKPAPRRPIHVYQDEHKIAMLYNFDNRWRMIWTDGRPLPKVVDGGVEIGGEYREARWFGYSVGRWVDDYTLEVVTVGTMPEDRVWLDNTGRPISDQARITERFRRLDNDTMEWSETIHATKIYHRPPEAPYLPVT